MTNLLVYPAPGPLVGSIPVPSDKSIGHRALLFGALCDGPMSIAGFSHGGGQAFQDVTRTIAHRVASLAASAAK